MKFLSQGSTSNIYGFDEKFESFIPSNLSNNPYYNMHDKILKVPIQGRMTLEQMEIEVSIGMILNLLDKGNNLDKLEAGDFFVQTYGIEEIFHEYEGTLTGILMEKLGGKTYTQMIKNSSLSLREKRIIAFYIAYAIYISQREFKFNHNDLIGSNIILVPFNDTFNTIKIGNGFEIPNIGLIPKIIDFGFSRLEYEGIKYYNERIRNLYYRDKDSVPFYNSPDLCKLFSNPNFDMKDEEFQKLFSNCNFNQNYGVIPPFPDINAEIIVNKLYDIIWKNE